MKNFNTLLVLTASVVSLTMNAVIVNDSTVRYSVGKYCSIEFSVQNVDENGNILHKIIRHFGNKDFEIRQQAIIKPGAVIAEIRQNIQQQLPYNKLPKLIAAELFWQDRMDEVAEETGDEIITDLKILLSEKDNDGKTPLDLLQEKPAFIDGLSAEFSTNDASINFADLSAEFLRELLQDGVEVQAQKEDRLSQRNIDRAFRNASILKLYNNN